MKTSVDALLVDLSEDDRISAIVSSFISRSDNASALAMKLLGAIAYVCSHMSSYSRCVLAGHLRDLADLCDQDLSLNAVPVPTQRDQ